MTFYFENSVLKTLSRIANLLHMIIKIHIFSVNKYLNFFITEN